MIVSPYQIELANDLIAKSLLQNPPLRIATAESCTAGLISATLTEVAGSSAIFDCGFVTYSNQSKTEMLDVPEALLKGHGAVSSQVAMAMAQGALTKSMADMSIAVTGIAGPGGGSPQKPVGLVYFGLARTGQDVVSHKELFGEIGRENVRAKTVEIALSLMIKALS